MHPSHDWLHFFYATCSELDSYHGRCRLYRLENWDQMHLIRTLKLEEHLVGQMLFFYALSLSTYGHLNARPMKRQRVELPSCSCSQDEIFCFSFLTV